MRTQPAPPPQRQRQRSNATSSRVPSVGSRYVDHGSDHSTAGDINRPVFMSTASGGNDAPRPERYECYAAIDSSTSSIARCAKVLRAADACTSGTYRDTVFIRVNT